MKYPTGKVLIEVLQERKAQDKRWGEQNHPVISNTPFRDDALNFYAAKAKETKEFNDVMVRHGTLGWDTVLCEEVYEALAESDPAKIREELIQVAAVAVAMIESLDRNELNRGE